MNGYAETDFWRKNNRIKSIQVMSDLIQFVFVTLADRTATQPIMLPQPVEGRVFTFTIQSVYSGTKYWATCVTELAFSDFPLTGKNKHVFCGIQFKSFEINLNKLRVNLKNDGTATGIFTSPKQECEEYFASGNWEKITNRHIFKMSYAVAQQHGGFNCPPEINNMLVLESCPTDGRVISSYRKSGFSDYKKINENKKIRCGFANKKGDIAVKDCADAGE
jgi:hypothetical protein